MDALRVRPSGLLGFHGPSLLQTWGAQQFRPTESGSPAGSGDPSHRWKMAKPRFSTQPYSKTQKGTLRVFGRPFCGPILGEKQTPTKPKKRELPVFFAKRKRSERYERGGVPGLTTNGAERSATNVTAVPFASSRPTTSLHRFEVVREPGLLQRGGASFVASQPGDLGGTSC